MSSFQWVGNQFGQNTDERSESYNPPYLHFYIATEDSADDNVRHSSKTGRLELLIDCAFTDSIDHRRCIL
jgi:hypothetical protein